MHALTPTQQTARSHLTSHRLGILSGGGFRLQPGTFLGVEYRGLAAQPPLLSRLVLGGEQLNFALEPSPEGGPDQLVLVASGLCPDLQTLAACLHDAYHGAVPSYRSACTACYGVNVVYELGQLGETIGWAGAAATVGDTSYYRWVHGLGPTGTRYGSG